MGLTQQVVYDTNNHGERPVFLERLTRLSGQTTFRELGGGGGSPYSARVIGHENALTLALSMGRRRMPVERMGETVYVPDPRDVGPDMAYTVATAVPYHREKIVAWLARKLATETGPKGRKAINYQNILAQHAYEIVAFGYSRSPLPKRLPVCWDDLKDIGVAWLWCQVDATLERAERAFTRETV